MSEQPNYKTMELESGIKANVTFQARQRKPFWAFAYEFWEYDDDTGEFLQPANGGSEFVQVCMCYGQDPDELLLRGIHRYGLPMPRDKADKKRYRDYLESLKESED